jgi:regulator of sirC expression with transglutaminase-like and TPR domain
MDFNLWLKLELLKTRQGQAVPLGAWLVVLARG